MNKRYVPATKKQIGAKIRKVREAKGLSVTWLAEAIDIRKQTLSAMELGESYPSVQSLQTICYVLEINPGEVL